MPSENDPDETTLEASGPPSEPTTPTPTPTGPDFAIPDAVRRLQPVNLPGHPGVIIHPAFALDPAQFPAGAIPLPPPQLPNFIPPGEGRPGCRTIWMAATVPVFEEELRVTRRRGITRRSIPWDREPASGEMPIVESETTRPKPPEAEDSEPKAEDSEPEVNYSRLGSQGFQRQAPAADLSPKISGEVAQEIRRNWYGRLAWVGSVIIFAVFLFFVVSSLAPNRSDREATAASALLATPTGLWTPQTLVDAFAEANGGRAALNNVQTIRLTGVLSDHTGDYAFYNLKRRPEDFFLRLTRETLQISIGVTPDEAWRSVQDTRASRLLVEDLDSPTEIAIRPLVGLFHPFTQFAIDGQGAISQIEETTDETGTPLIKVAFTPASSNRTYTILIDRQTLNMVGSEYTSATGDVIRSAFSEVENVDFLKLPRLVINYRNDQEQNRLVISDATLNPGVISLVFERPEAID